MKVQVHLHAILRDLLPGGRGEVEIPQGSTIKDLLDQLGVEEELRDLVTVNTEQTESFDRVLVEGDLVNVFPGVSGG